VQLRAGRLRRQLGSAHMIVGIDRLDYTKGILERLHGFERFLEQSPAFRRRVTFVQIAVPSRERVDEYRRMKREIDESVGRISGRFTSEGGCRSAISTARCRRSTSPRTTSPPTSRS